MKSYFKVYRELDIYVSVSFVHVLYCVVFGNGVRENPPILFVFQSIYGPENIFNPLTDDKWFKGEIKKKKKEKKFLLEVWVFFSICILPENSNITLCF